MRSYLTIITVLAMLAFAGALMAQSDFPLIKTVQPNIVQRGAVLTISGENLDRANVAAVYLTDGQNDCKVLIGAQTAKTITITVPNEAKGGRFALMILTAGDTPKYIEEPVKVTVQ